MWAYRSQGRRHRLADRGAKVMERPVKVRSNVRIDRSSRAPKDLRCDRLLAGMAGAFDDPDRKRRQRRYGEPRSDRLDGRPAEGGDPVPVLDAMSRADLLCLRQQIPQVDRAVSSLRRRHERRIPYFR